MPIATSTLGFVETVRTMNRIGDYPDLMRDLVNRFTEILLTEEVRDAAAHLPGALDTLVTYDKRMLDVARAEGLPVEAPDLL